MNVRPKILVMKKEFIKCFKNSNALNKKKFNEQSYYNWQIIKVKVYKIVTLYLIMIAYVNNWSNEDPIIVTDWAINLSVSKEESII